MQPQERDSTRPQAGATPGSRPKERNGRLDRMASALEFASLRDANSVGSKRSFVSAKQGGHPLARVPALFGGEAGTYIEYCP